MLLAMHKADVKQVEGVEGGETEGTCLLAEEAFAEYSHARASRRLRAVLRSFVVC